MKIQHVAISDDAKLKLCHASVYLLQPEKGIVESALEDYYVKWRIDKITDNAVKVARSVKEAKDDDANKRSTK